MDFALSPRTEEVCPDVGVHEGGGIPRGEGV